MREEYPSTRRTHSIAAASAGRSAAAGLNSRHVSTPASCACSVTRTLPQMETAFPSSSATTSGAQVETSPRQASRYGLKSDALSEVT